MLFTRSPTSIIRFDLHISMFDQGTGGRFSSYLYRLPYYEFDILLYCRRRQSAPVSSSASPRQGQTLYRVPAVAALCRPPTLPYPCLGLPLSPAGRRSTREPLTPTLWSGLRQLTGFLNDPYVSDRKWCAGFAFSRYCCFHSLTIDVTVCSLKYKNLDSNSSMKLRQAK